MNGRLIREARPARVFLVASVLVGIATGAAVVVQAVLIADGIATVVTIRSTDGLARTAWLLAAVVALRAGLVWLQEVVAVRASAAVKSALRRRLLAHALRLGPGWLGGERSSELTTLATRGLDGLDPYFARYLPQSVLAATVPAGVVCWLFRTDVLAAVTVLVTLPLIPVFMALVGLATQARSRGRQRALTMLAHHFADVVAGLPTLRLFGRASAQPDAVRRVTDRHRVLSMASLRLAFLSSLVLELLVGVSVALVAVGIGLRLVEGRLGLETALLVLVLAPEAYLPLRQLGAQFHASADGLAAAERVFAVLDTPVPKWGSRREPPDLRRVPLRLEGVTARYPGRAPLDLPDLEIRPGEFVVLTGPSGAGKSTALSVLLGFTDPECGVVSAGPHLQRDFTPAAWRTAFAWVPQRPGLLAGTVADNVRLARPDAPDAAIDEALAAAAAPTPDTQVGEQGKLLSGGERRRVALARALLTNAPVLLLDEPTAGQDPATEAHLLTTLHTSTRTVVLVTHRQSGPADQRVTLHHPQPPDHLPQIARRVADPSPQVAPHDNRRSGPRDRRVVDDRAQVVLPEVDDRAEVAWRVVDDQTQVAPHGWAADREVCSGGEPKPDSSIELDARFSVGPDRGSPGRSFAELDGSCSAGPDGGSPGCSIGDLDGSPSAERRGGSASWADRGSPQAHGVGSSGFAGRLAGRSIAEAAGTTEQVAR